MTDNLSLNSSMKEEQKSHYDGTQSLDDSTSSNENGLTP